MTRTTGAILRMRCIPVNWHRRSWTWNIISRQMTVNEYGPLEQAQIRVLAWARAGWIGNSQVRSADSEDWSTAVRPSGVDGELLATSRSAPTTTHPLVSGGRYSLCSPSRGNDPHVRDFEYSLLSPVSESQHGSWATLISPRSKPV